MSHPAGELADRLHLLRLMQDRLGSPPFSDFGGNPLFKGLVELLQRFDSAYPVDGRAEEVGDRLEAIRCCAR